MHSELYYHYFTNKSTGHTARGGALRGGGRSEAARFARSQLIFLGLLREGVMLNVKKLPYFVAGPSLELADPSCLAE